MGDLDLILKVIEPLSSIWFHVFCLITFSLKLGLLYCTALWFPIRARFSFKINDLDPISRSQTGGRLSVVFAQ